MDFYKDYKPGDVTRIGEVIHTIIHINNYLIVYLNEGLAICWEFEDNDPNVNDDPNIWKGFHRIHSKIRKKIPNREESKLLIGELGSLLYQGLTTDSKKFDFKLFNQFEERIDRLKTEAQIKISYSVLMICASGILLSFLYLVYEFGDIDNFDRPSLLSASGGLLGASFSVIYRTQDIGPRFIKMKYLIFEAFTKCVLGIITGIFLYFAIQSNFIFGFLTNDIGQENNPAIYFFLSFVSGISERIIPDIVKKTEQEVL